MPQLESLTSLQMDEIGRLRYASRQAEDALSRGVDKLQQTLTQIMFAEAVGVEMYGIQMTSALEKLGAIEGFVNQVIHFVVACGMLDVTFSFLPYLVLLK